MSKQKSEEKPFYYVFSKYIYENDDHWRFFDCYATKEDAEIDMEMIGEPEPIEFKIIKGIELRATEGVARYPWHIEEEL